MKSNYKKNNMKRINPHQIQITIYFGLTSEQYQHLEAIKESIRENGRKAGSAEWQIRMAINKAQARYVDSLPKERAS